MDIVFPPKVRATLYILVVLGGAILLPLDAANVIDHLIMQVFTSVATAVSALAAFNVTRKV